MIKIKNYFQSFPTVLFLISGILVTLFILANFLIYRHYQPVFLSSAQMTVSNSETSSSLNLAFNIAPSEIKDFKKLANLLGLDWAGEKVDFQVNQTLGNKLQNFNNQIVNLKPGVKSLQFSSAIPHPSDLVSKKLWQSADKLPEDATFYLETTNPFWGLPDPLKRFFGSSRGVVALFPTGEGGSLVWLKNDIDTKIFGNEVKDLKEKLLTAATPSIRIEEIVIERLPLSKLTVNTKSYFFGVIDTALFASSSEEGFKTLVKVKNKSKNSLLANKTFNQNNYQVSNEGSLALFIGDTTKLNIFSAREPIIRELFILTGKDRENFEKYLNQVDGFTLVVNSINNLEGVVNFR